jgi:Fe-S oxidoreductase
MAKYKAEFLQHWHDANGIPLRTRLIANISELNKLGMMIPSVFNFFVTNAFTSGLMKKSLGFAPKRTIPALYKITLRNWVKKLSSSQNIEIKGKVFLFADEFTDVNDVEIGIKAVKLLNKLGYKVEIPDHVESGRAYLSKGYVRKAQQLAKLNIKKLHSVITEQSPLIGIEPSAILSFRDEYPDLAGNELKSDALKLATNCLMFDEFIVREVQKGNIMPSQFTDAKQHIRLHGHCHQKALASTGPTKEMLSLPSNYTIDEIKSGCCGMAGSFGYEKEHYDVSMKVGELVLLPEVRKTPEHTIISAPGTSCRHQIKDGTGRIALHPIEVLYGALLT